MARQIVGEYVNGGVLETIWPAPTNRGGYDESHGPDGIEDPRLRWQLWDVSARLLDADRQRTPRNPEEIARLKAILGQAGYAGVVIEDIVA